MENPKEYQLEFKLNKVLETGYFADLEYLESHAFDGDLMKIEFGFKIDIQKQNKVLVLHLLTKYTYPIDGVDAKILELTSANYFEIKNLNDVISIEENRFTDKANILPTLLGISIGTIRGIMVVKTAGTALANYPLPIVSPADILKGSKSPKRL